MVSARVLNPAMLGEFCKLSASPAVNRIKRDLFGTAKAKVSEASNNRHLTAEMERHQELAAQKWGFDFRAGCPLGVNSPFIWERVSFQESSFAPEMYTLTRAAHVRPAPVAAAPASDMDLLLNERAERENFAANLTSSSLESTTDNEFSYDSHDESSLVGRLMLPHSGHSLASSSRKRQLKITEFMKERKRLAQAPKKISPAKRLRTSSGSSGGISAHFGLLKRPRHN